MSHPSLGLPPLDETAGFPAAAARLRDASARVGLRALEAAVDADSTLPDRLGETGMRWLLRDTEIWTDRLAFCVATAQSSPMRDFAEMIAPVYRRRRVPMDDLVGMAEGFRASIRAVLGPEEQVPANAALDGAIAVFRWHRRLAGDARKRNKIIAFIYKGA